MFENTFFFKAAVEIQQLWLGTTMFVVVIVLLSKTSIFNTAVIEKQFSLNKKMFLILVFSTLGIMGTYWGIITPHGIINTRAIGVISGGLIGGPFVGTGAGIVTGIHRIFFLDTFTSAQSGLITILQGICAGLLSATLKNKKRMWLWAFLICFILECLHMVLLLIFAKPYETAAILVQNIAPSMLLTNSVGVGLFIGVLKDNYLRLEAYSLQATRNALRVVNLIVEGLKERNPKKTEVDIANIIYENIDSLSWVAIVKKNNDITLVNKNEGFELVREYVKGQDFFRNSTTMKVASDEKYTTLSSPVKSNNEASFIVVIGKPIKAIFTNFEKELLSGLSSLLEIQITINELNKQDVLLSEAEVKVLQAQINPHFLFNALNTVSYYCRSDPSTAKALVVYLAEYYRHSLSSPKIFINFEEELQHVKAYLNIETARFGDRLKVEYDIPEHEPFTVPSLILQPLVENAIKHGILSKEEGGTIYVGLISESDGMKIYVFDDGKGIPEEKLKYLLENPAETKSGEKYKSIGLLNVQKRLLTMYGPESGLQIMSKLNVGTSVSFKIPKQKRGGSTDA